MLRDAGRDVGMVAKGFMARRVPTSEDMLEFRKLSIRTQVIAAMYSCQLEERILGTQRRNINSVKLEDGVMRFPNVEPWPATESMWNGAGYTGHYGRTRTRNMGLLRRSRRHGVRGRGV